MNSVPYLENLSDHAKDKERLAEVQAALDSRGSWHDLVEWRISTVMELSIESIGRYDKPQYRVRVKCGNELECITPTVERAVEFLGIYERLVMDLFWSIGWPSWASKSQLDP